MKISTFVFYCFVLILFLTESNVIKAQTNIDSLKQQVQNESEPKKKAAIYYDIAEFYYYTNLDSSLYYAQHYLKASKNANDTAWTADAQSYIAYVYDEKGEIELALEYFQKALENFTLLQDSLFIGICYCNIGYMTSYGMDQAKGLSYFLQAMQIAEAIQDTGLIADVGSNIAYYYDRVNDNETALRYAQKTLKYSLASQDSVSIALSYADLASINIKLKNYNDASQLLMKSKQMISKGHSDYQLAYLHSSFAEYYLDWKQIDSAQIYINKSENILRTIDNKILISYLYQQKGNLAFLKKEYQNCFEYLDKSIVLFKKVNIIEPLSEIYSKQAEAYSALQMHSQAYKSLQMANSLIDSMGYGILANMLGEFEQKRINKIENEKHNLQIALSNQKLENNKIKMRTNSQIALFSILFLVCIIAIGLYSFIKNRKKNVTLKNKNHLINEQKKQVEINEKELKELNSTKDKFFSIIAHDLKNPIAQMIQFSNLLENQYSELPEKKAIKIINRMKESSSMGFKLLENLLEWANSQTGVISFHPEPISVFQLIEENIELLLYRAEEKNIQIINNVDRQIIVPADRNMINTVFRNIISNAIKFTFSKGQIEISSRIQQDNIEIICKDNGIGLTEEESQKLFKIDSGFTMHGTEYEKGTGLGLILCKEFIDKHNGKIWIESEKNIGSTVVVSIPSTVIEKGATGQYKSVSGKYYI